MTAKSKSIQDEARRIAEVLHDPGAVALIPTETVYALVCRASDADAVEKIRLLKHRDPSKFFGWFIKDWHNAEKYGLVVTPEAEKLFQRYFPGAVTLILKKEDGTTQGVRTPDHPLTSALLGFFDEPLIQTSANASGMPDALSLQQALSQLHGEPDVFFDGGELPPNAKGSTIVDVTRTPPVIIRQGHVAVTLD